MGLHSAHEGPAVNVHTHTELGNSPEPQLYDLSLDIGQIRNLAAERGDMVRALSIRLDEIHRSRQTRPVTEQAGEAEPAGWRPTADSRAAPAPLVR